jgi:hypothetical protein
VFDFRYHVVSLAAVFLALLFGILIGVGISGRGLVDEAERIRLQADIAELEGRLEDAGQRSRDQQAAEEYVRESYDAVMRDRLAGRGVAIVFVDSAPARVRSAVVEAITAAGGQAVRLRVVDVPVSVERVVAALEAEDELADLADEDRLGDLGRLLGQELVTGGESPLWTALAQHLVVERSGRDSPPVDAVVVGRPPYDEDDEATARFLEGFYAGLTATVPAVAVETTDAYPSTLDAFRRTNLSTVDNVDRPVGRVALVVLLAGAPGGHYGVREDADGVLPPVEPVRPEAGE